MKISKKHKGESFESLMRRFKKGCEKGNILLEVKNREHYERPSIGRKKRRQLAISKEKKRQEEQKLHRFR